MMYFVLFFINMNCCLKMLTLTVKENIIEIKPLIKDEIPAANSPLLS